MFGSFILDFAACAIVANGRRHFLGSQELQVVAALLIAEGKAVPTERICKLCRFDGVKFARKRVSRLIRRLKQTELAVNLFEAIEAVPGGYRMVVRRPRHGA